MFQSAMLARLFLRIFLACSALAPFAAAQSTGQPIVFHLRFVSLDPGAEAAISSYLAPAAAQEGISVASLPAGIDSAGLLRRAAAAGTVETLAESDVLADNNQEATFRAGSSFPLPKVDPVTGGVSVVYQEFGLRLDLLPAMDATGIGVRVVSQASFLDYQHALTIAGFTIPAVPRRTQATQLELAAGQSFAISGLVNADLVRTLSKLPSRTGIPLLEAIAASRGSKVLALVTPAIQ